MSLVQAYESIGSNKTQTTNGAKAYKSTKSYVLDYFEQVGSSRGKDLSPLYIKALNEDPELAARCALWSRDIRGGAGERQHFRNAFKILWASDPLLAEKVSNKVAEVGRWDDLLVVYNDYNVGLIAKALKDGNGLCAKWMPRKGETAVKLREDLDMTPKQYRKTLVNLTKVVETQMCAQDWKKIEYSHVPSQASRIYKNAFKKHDLVRYEKFLDKAVKGEVKVSAGAIFPHTVLRELIHGNTTNEKLAVAQWNNLPDYIGEGSFLPVIDVSGSMYGQPLEIAVSLGLYLSERNKGIFKDVFVTFSAKPQFQKTSGSIANRIRQVVASNWGMNTNLDSVFEQMVNLAVKNKLPQSDLPKVILILSDMQFDGCVKYTAKQEIKNRFEMAGYQMPAVVFWNLNHYGNSPVKMNQKGVATVSGFSPSIMKSVLRMNLEVMTPYSMMLKTLSNERYNLV